MMREIVNPGIDMGQCPIRSANYDSWVRIAPTNQ